jgi:beta-xylosidase
MGFEALRTTWSAVRRITFNDLAVHDPSVIRADDGSYYVFGAHLAAARSTDLMNWQYIANGVNPANRLWSTIPEGGMAWTDIPGSWAADVIKRKDGKYSFYYSFCGMFPTTSLPAGSRGWLPSHAPYQNWKRIPARNVRGSTARLIRQFAFAPSQSPCVPGASTPGAYDSYQ